jgi:uroporphyrinogen-III synthase
VQIVFDRLVAWGLTPRVFASTSVAAIGSATGDMLTVKGVVPAVIPGEFVAEALAAELVRHSGGSLVGSRVLIPSAEDAREALAAGLREHGADVEAIAVYRTVPVTADLSGLAADITRGRIDAVTFTSSSTVRSFVDLVGRPAATSGRFVAATIGPITAGTARELGLRQIIEAEPHTIPGLVESLAKRFA